MDDIVNEFNNTYHRRIKMKPIDVTSNNYIEYNVNSNKKDPKFQVGGHLRISKDKNIFAIAYAPIWSEEICIIKKVRNTLPGTYGINDLNNEGIIGTFDQKELQKTNQKEFRIEKVPKKKGNKLYVKWKGHDNSFNSWVDKKNIVK